MIYERILADQVIKIQTIPDYRTPIEGTGTDGRSKTVTFPMTSTIPVSTELKAQLIKNAHLVALTLVCKRINTTIKHIILSNPTLQILPMVEPDGN
jgi:hypothetical protein